MRKTGIFFVICLMIFSPALLSEPREGLKIFISVDMEGIAGVVSPSECSPKGSDYDYFRRLMTLETNSAIEGALSAGATDIVVRDGHGSKTNIFPDLLHKGAKLLRGVTDKPENMMLGIDSSFDAVLFIGYHAKAGTAEGILAHTSSGNVIDLSINGVSLPEAGYNALVAGLYDVPVVLIAGDNWICQQALDLFGDIETVETKKGFGTSELGLHPEIVRELIKEGAAEALKNLNRFKPYKMKPPYTMVLKVKTAKPIYPGAKETGENEFTFTSSNLLDVLDALNRMK